MTICEYCIDTLFQEPYWKPREKQHHTDSAKWQDSIKQCTICSTLLDTIKDIVIKTMESDISLMFDTYLRFEPILNAGILSMLQDALPLYSVALHEFARDQFLLIFQPIEENVRKIEIPTPFGRVMGLVLPVRKFQVYSTVYDGADIPRLSNETGLDGRGNKRNERTLGRVRDWLEKCNGEHEHCGHFERAGGGKKRFVPTRLIAVGKEGDESVRLVVTEGRDEFRQYASLSHCWGGFITVCTYDNNYEQHKKSITLDANFPRNFLDAITLCRTLEIKYIWIDSLCIIQKSTEDWVKEAPRMHEVYGNSYLNIAATSARNSTEGLFRKRRINPLSPSVVRCNWQGRSRYCKVIREDFWSGELLAEPLYKRAWVAQERMLAPRTLNFGTKQLFWQCLTIAACETMPEGIPGVVRNAGRGELQWRRLLQESREDRVRPVDEPHPKDKERRPGEVDNNSKVELQEVWRDAVKNYTSCNITNTVDKLPAVAGMAQVMYDCCQEDYVAGLWVDKEEGDIDEGSKQEKNKGDTNNQRNTIETWSSKGENLVLQLAWRVKDCKNVEGRPSRRQRQDEYRAPTWAWPSVVDGIIELPRRVRVEKENTTVSLQLTDKPYLIYTEKDSEPAQKFMCLKGGWLNVTGSLYTVRFFDAHDVETPCWCWDLPHVPKEERPWVYMYPDEPFRFLDTSGASVPSDTQNEHSSPADTQNGDIPILNGTHEPTQDTESTNGIGDRNPRDFTILPLSYKDEAGFFSGRALVVQEELDENKYQHVPREESRPAMFTRTGLVEFRKVPEDLWGYFRERRYEVKGGSGKDGDTDGRIEMVLL